MHKLVSPTFVFALPLVFASAATRGAPTTVHAAERRVSQSARIGHADSASLHNELQRATDAFLLKSRATWMASSSAASNGGSTSSGRRMANIHCHRDGSWGGRDNVKSRNGIPATVIGSFFSLFAVCPDWSLSPQRPSDESVRPDAAIGPAAYQRIVDMRQALLARLDSAAAGYPRDWWVSAQRVRFRADAGQLDLALNAARECRAEYAFCTRVRAYVEYVMGHHTIADSLFTRVSAAMTDSIRCRWTSAQDILPRESRLKYQDIPCAQRDSINRNIWWLADPMFSEAGNERRVEHFARLVRTELHFSNTLNDRWNLRDRNGGDAIRIMYLRYGWPTSFAYGGPATDQSHSEWLKGVATPPCSAPEYSMDRISTLPSWDAIIDPITVQDSDFVLTAPSNIDPSAWWPSEHFRRARGTIASLAPGQPALLRRDSSVLFAVATRLQSPELSSRLGQVVPTSLIVSPRPDSVQLVTSQLSSLGRTALLQGFIPGGAALAGVEINVERGQKLAARSRFGIVAPPTLREMRRSEVAVSGPVLFDAAALEGVGVSEMGNIVDAMYPSTVLEGAKQVGVYWESYGFRKDDTVDVSVQIERVNEVSRLRRIAMAFRVTTDPNFTVIAHANTPRLHPDDPRRIRGLDQSTTGRAHRAHPAAAPHARAIVRQLQRPQSFRIAVGHEAVSCGAQRMGRHRAAFHDFPRWHHYDRSTARAVAGLHQRQQSEFALHRESRKLRSGARHHVR